MKNFEGDFSFGPICIKAIINDLFKKETFVGEINHSKSTSNCMLMCL